MPRPIRFLPVLGLAVLLIGSHASALPEFSARTGERCQSCHVNPAGRGMRTPSGASYGRDDLPVPAWKKALELDSIDTGIAPMINIGTDVRTLYFFNEIDNTGSFFQMEGNLYLDFRLNKKFRICFSKGLYQGFELFGLARVLPAQGYIKVGKFVPAYGMRIDDHNAFIRGGRYSNAFNRSIPNGYPMGLRFGERSEDTGIELGISPSVFTFNVGMFNGSPGGGISGTTGTKNYAFVARGEALIPSDFINITVGGSFYNQKNPTIGGKTQFYGAFGSLSLGGNLTLISEVDWAITQVQNREVTGRMFYNELYYEITRGLNLLVGYEFYDPDINLENGVVSTINVGASFYPMSGVEMRPIYRINKEKPVEITNNELNIMLHFYL
ncbi:MAG TPA: hypothetical protein VK470_12955 [Bacteroidota bacterium]|nr:hypothetical protein [Bacteroidota bacterium]